MVALSFSVAKPASGRRRSPEMPVRRRAARARSCSPAIATTAPRPRPTGRGLNFSSSMARSLIAPQPCAAIAAPSLTQSSSQATLFGEMRGFLIAIARERPLVIVLDDVHWADSASLDLLRFVARQLASVPILLLITYRSDEVTREHPLYRLMPMLVREALAVRIDLSPLSNDDVCALIDHAYQLPDGRHEPPGGLSPGTCRGQSVLRWRVVAIPGRDGPAAGGGRGLDTRRARAHSGSPVASASDRRAPGAARCGCGGSPRYCRHHWPGGAARIVGQR